LERVAEDMCKYFWSGKGRIASCEQSQAPQDISWPSKLATRRLLTLVFLAAQATHVGNQLAGIVDESGYAGQLFKCDETPQRLHVYDAGHRVLVGVGAKKKGSALSCPLLAATGRFVSHSMGRSAPLQFPTRRLSGQTAAHIWSAVPEYLFVWDIIVPGWIFIILVLDDARANRRLVAWMILVKKPRQMLLWIKCQAHVLHTCASALFDNEDLINPLFRACHVFLVGSFVKTVRGAVSLSAGAVRPLRNVEPDAGCIGWHRRLLELVWAFGQPLSTLPTRTRRALELALTLLNTDWRSGRLGHICFRGCPCRGDNRTLINMLQDVLDILLFSQSPRPPQVVAFFIQGGTISLYRPPPFPPPNTMCAQH